MSARHASLRERPAPDRLARHQQMAICGVDAPDRDERLVLELEKLQTTLPARLEDETLRRAGDLGPLLSASHVPPAKPSNLYCRDPRREDAASTSGSAKPSRLPKRRAVRGRPGPRGPGRNPDTTSPRSRDPR